MLAQPLSMAVDGIDIQGMGIEQNPSATFNSTLHYSNIPNGDWTKHTP